MRMIDYYRDRIDIYKLFIMIFLALGIFSFILILSFGYVVTGIITFAIFCGWAALAKMGEEIMKLRYERELEKIENEKSNV